jgi:ribosomal protein S20
LIGAYDDAGWVALLLEEVDGHPPASPWRPDELAAALRALDRLADVAAPAGVPPATEVLGEDFCGWRLLAADPPADLAPWQAAHLAELVELEAAWPEAAAGDRLLHLDARGDNMLVRPDGEILLVDWPWAAVGNPVLDVVGFLPSALMHGAGDPEELLSAAGGNRRPVAPPAHRLVNPRSRRTSALPGCTGATRRGRRGVSHQYTRVVEAKGRVIMVGAGGRGPAVSSSARVWRCRAPANPRQTERGRSTVANIKSQIKRIKTNEQARLRNKSVKSSLKTAIRKFREAADAGDVATATELMKTANKQLDKAASKGVIHANQAANRKSAIAKRTAQLASTSKS